MLYEFNLNHNAVEATQNICCAKGDDAVDHSNLMVPDILLWLQEPQQSNKVRSKTIDSEVVFEAIEEI